LISPIDEINLFQYLHKEKEYLRKKKNLLGEKERKKRNNGAGETAGLKCQQDSPAGIARCLLCVCILSAETHAALRTAAQSERYKRQREKYIYFYFLLFLCVYLFRNDCPRNCGRTGPLGLTGRSSSCVCVLCCMGAPVTLCHIQVSAAERLCDVGNKKKKGQTRAPTK
jgi:hypothetical protein